MNSLFSKLFFFEPSFFKVFLFLNPLFCGSFDLFLFANPHYFHFLIFKFYFWEGLMKILLAFLVGGKLQR
ncbi:hypothetical protein CGC32_02890 [Helicobacter pylori]|nr:hypothetical protein CGC32_02890 [Helicobacter pylori]